MNLKNKLKYLKSLEDESIYIIREAIAEAENPVMLYSIGKDSSVLVHLAMKAFYPAKPPFPLMHIDTTWKFKEMIDFRNKRVKELGLDLIVFVNEEGINKGINPFIHGSKIFTDIMKTESLKKALNKFRFDMILCGARRDEEKSRAKERIFSFRDKNHRWEPKRQRPELWNVYNLKKNRGESFRVFPLSNWTELDVWLYIFHENIQIVPLYFARERLVTKFNNTWILIDDNRVPKKLREKAVKKSVRFRTLGCYPLTGAIDSKTKSIEGIIEEITTSEYSERQGRLIDFDQLGSMESKKIEGYF